MSNNSPPENKFNEGLNIHIKSSNKWIKSFENMIESKDFEEKSMQGVIQSFISLKERFGDTAENYVKFGLSKSDKVKEFFKNNKDTILGEMFNYQTIKENFLTNKTLLIQIQRMNSKRKEMSENPEKFRSKRSIIKKPENKKNDFGFIETLKIDVAESLGIKPDLNIKNKQNKTPIEKLMLKKAKQIEHNDLFDFSTFAKSFSNYAKDSETQEALAWFSAYIESEDFSYDDIIIKDNTIDTEETILNISKKINERSLSPYEPFAYSKESGKLIYNQAPSNTVDVMLFIENSQKIIGASATKDRTVKIEGNQFLRHSFKIKAIGVLLEEEVEKIDSNKIDKNKLKSSTVRDIINDRRFQFNLNGMSKLEKIKNRLHKDVYENFTNSRRSEFTTHISILRDRVLDKFNIDLHKNGLEITSNEIQILNNTSKFDNEYLFFGEVTNKSKLPELFAGLNKFAYKENFIETSSFTMDDEAINSFLESIKYKYNNVEKTDMIDNYAHRFILSVLDKSIDVKDMARELSEGSVFKEERELVFKSISTIINKINKINDLNRPDVLNLLKDNLHTLNNSEINSLTESVLESGSSAKVKEKLSKITKAQSEVSNEYREMENSLDQLEVKKDLSSLKNNLSELSEYGDINEIRRKLELLDQINTSTPKRNAKIKSGF